MHLLIESDNRGATAMKRDERYRLNLPVNLTTTYLFAMESVRNEIRAVEEALKAVIENAKCSTPRTAKVPLITDRQMRAQEGSIRDK